MIERFKNGKPFIIAEMSGNHDQSLERAKKIVEEAAKAGADAIKLQTYTADTMTIKGVYEIEDKDSLWDGNELHSLYEKAHTPWEWHKEIFDYARELGLIPFSTPFDFSSVDFLEELGVEIYKIASFENTDIPLIKKVAQTGKPVIISTGAASLSQIDLAVSTLRENGCNDFVILKCTSTYPAPPESTNLNTIPYLKKIFNCPVGLSDHTLGIGAAIASIALGATVIEKHFTLDRNDGAVDSAFSLEPAELAMLTEAAERAYLALGDVHFGLTDSEAKAVEFKRSVYVAENIKEGDVFTTDNIRVIRPGFGLEPKYFEMLLGKTAKQNIEKGTPLTWDLLI